MSKKKGVSTITSYVIVVAIAIVIAVLLFSLLKVYVPKEKTECKQGIDLVIETAICGNYPDGNKMGLVLVNTGRFKIDRVFIRVGETTSNFKEDIKEYILELNPDESKTLPPIDLPPDYNKKKEYILQVQPSHKTEKGDYALCPVVVQKINCLNPTDIKNKDYHFVLSTGEPIISDGGGGGQPSSEGSNDQQNIPSPDSDADKITDSSDNCQFASNPDQKDTDRDKIGDVCDTTPGSTTASPSPSPSPQSTSSAQSSPIPSSTTKSCTFTSAYWSTSTGQFITSTSEGSQVRLKVIGTQECNGQTAIFTQIREADTFADDIVAKNLGTVTISENLGVAPFFKIPGKRTLAFVSWTTVWQFDGFTDPEYYFTAKLKEDKSETIDSGLLTVTRSSSQAQSSPSP